MKLNKKLFILLIAVLSLISFTVGVKAESWSSSNQNGGQFTGGGGNPSSGSGTYFSNSRNILKIRVIRGNSVVASGFVDITGNKNSAMGMICDNTSSSAALVNVGSISQGGFACKSGSLNIDYTINYGRAWDFNGIDGVGLNNYMVNSGTYNNLKNILKGIGYTTPQNDDYVIIEPVLDVSCNDTIYYGTVTSLLANDIGGPQGGGSCKYQFMYVYGRIIESYKVKSGIFHETNGNKYTCVEDCNTSGCKPGFEVTTRSTFDYAGCGYNRYNVSDMPWNEPGKILIKKTTTNGITIRSSAKFSLYSDSACTTLIASNLSTSSGILEYKSDKIIKDTNYYLKETSAPSGYHTPKNNCIAVKAVSLNTVKSNAKEIQNPSECEYDFDELADKSMTGRIQFYLSHGKYKNYKNILNLNKTTGKDACTPIETKTNYESGCLGIKTNYDTSFKETNLSSYDSIQTYENNTYSFCKTIFSFNSNVGENGSIKNSYSYNNGKIDFGLFKSGKMVLSRNVENKKIAEGILNIVCYVYGPKSTQYVNDKSYKETDYNSKVKSVMLYKNSDKTKVNYLTNENFKSFVTNTNIASPQCIKHNVTLTYDYSLSPIYARYGLGEVVSKTSSLKKREIGYGIISSFKEIGKVKLKFDAKIGDETISNDYCTYSVKQELVKCIDGTCDDSDDSWELNLAFRQISKSNPFPGKDGTGRKTGSNWCDGSNCNVENNNIIKETITDKNDSYNSTGTGPKYIINLNSKTIEQIKDKYKDQAYDDFGENCDDRQKGTCANNFIDWMNDQGYLIKKAI